MDATDDAKTAALSEANGHIADVAVGVSPGETVWQFFCECGHSHCDARVDMSLNRYARILDELGAVIAPGHRMNESARAARLREEARALRAEALLQMRRVRKRAP